MTAEIEEVVEHAYRGTAQHLFPDLDEGFFEVCPWCSEWVRCGNRRRRRPCDRTGCGRGGRQRSQYLRHRSFAVACQAEQCPTQLRSYPRDRRTFKLGRPVPDARLHRLVDAHDQRHRIVVPLHVVERGDSQIRADLAVERINRVVLHRRRHWQKAGPRIPPPPELVRQPATPIHRRDSPWR